MLPPCRDAYLEPKNAIAYNNKGIYQASLHQNLEAIESYNKAIELDSQNALFFCGKGKTLFDLGREAEALECFNQAAFLASSGNLGSNLSEGNKTYIKTVLTEDRANLIKKLSEFASIQVETLEITAENEESISKALTFKKQGSISKSKGLKLLQKELISEAVDALDSKNNGPP